MNSNNANRGRGRSLMESYVAEFRDVSRRGLVQHYLDMGMTAEQAEATVDTIMSLDEDACERIDVLSSMVQKRVNKGMQLEGPSSER